MTPCPATLSPPAPASWTTWNTSGCRNCRKAVTICRFSNTAAQPVSNNETYALAWEFFCMTLECHPVRHKCGAHLAHLSGRLYRRNRRPALRPPSSGVRSTRPRRSTNDQNQVTLDAHEHQSILPAAKAVKFHGVRRNRVGYSAVISYREVIQTGMVSQRDNSGQWPG